MKKWVFVFAAVLTLSLLRNNSVRAQDHQLTKIWQTDSVLKTPESVLFVPGATCFLIQISMAIPVQRMEMVLSAPLALMEKRSMLTG